MGSVVIPRAEDGFPRVDVEAVGEVLERYPHSADLSGVLRSEVLPGFYIRTEWLWVAESPDQIDVAREWGLI